MTQPLLLVEAPPISPYKYGLESVAVPASTADPHWALGVEYEPIGGYETAVLPGACYEVPTPTVALPSGVPSVKGLPFSVYAGVECNVVGYTEDYVLSRAQAILKLGWQHAAEIALWSGAEGNAPALTSAGTTIATALSMVDAVAALEDYLASNYLGVGVIHAPRMAAPKAQQNRQIVERVNQLQTILGTQWVFGGGYPNTGPGDAAPGTNIAWLYVTGLITVRRAAPFVNGGLGQALNRSTNVQTVFAEQPSLLTLDGPLAAVSVDLTL